MVRLRRQHKWGPACIALLVELPVSTVNRILVRHGVRGLLEDAPADPGNEEVRATQRRVDVVGPEERHSGQADRALGLNGIPHDLQDSLVAPHVTQVDGQPEEGSAASRTRRGPCLCTR